MKHYKLLTLQNIFYGAATVLLLFAAIMQVYMAVDGDKDWLLLLARKMTQGQILYKDILEINPPLILWLYQIPVYISNQIGLQDTKTLVLLTLILIVISLAVSTTVLKTIPTFFPSTTSYRLTVLLIAFILIFLPNSIYFGDREHFLVTLIQTPVYISNRIGLQDVRILVLLTLILTVISLAVSATVLKTIPTFFPSTTSYRLTVLLIAFILIFLPNSSYFGDREHLFVTLVLPFIIRFMPTVSTQSLSLMLRLIIAFMAAIGFCIKPHLLVFFVTIQIFRLAYTRNWRVLFVMENWVVGGAWALYMLLIYTLTPEYFSFAIPMAISAYGVFTRDIVVSVFFYSAAFLSVIFIFAGMKWHLQTPYKKTIYFLFGLMLAAVGYVALNNGWAYTFYPLNSLVMLGLGFAWLEYNWIAKHNSGNEKLIRDMKGARFFCAIVLVCTIAGTLFPYGKMFFIPQPKTYYDKLQEDLPLVLKKSNASSFGQLFSSYDWSRLALVTNTRFEGHFRCAWPLPHYLKGDNAFKARNAWWIPTYLRQSAAEDLNTHKPDIVFVDTSPEYSNTDAPFDIVHYLSQDAQFAAVWEHYAFFQRINRCGEIDQHSNKAVNAECQFDVFKRRDKPQGQQ